MATAFQAPSRPRLSDEYIEAHRRTRLINGFAQCVVDRGYHATRVEDIVRAAGVARGTFYDCFPNKEAVALALIGEEGWPDSASVLAVEIASLYRLGETDRAEAAIREAREMLAALAEFEAEPLEHGGEDDPLLATLPPARHRLPRSFVHESQRRRLLVGVAAAVSRHGYFNATITHITRHAAVSRRTFYEHFSTEGAVPALVSYAEAECGLPSLSVDLNTGLGAVWVEVIAAELADDHDGAVVCRCAAEHAVNRVDPGRTA